MRFSPVFASCSSQLRRVVVSLAIASLLALVCSFNSSAQSPNDQPSDTVSGTVINSVTHEPIGRALVYTMDERAAVLTDDHGHFELTLPGAPTSSNSTPQMHAPAMLQVKKPGYLSEQGSPGGDLVQPGQKEITLSLNPEGLIIGQVKFPSADAADYAQVDLYRREVRDGVGQWEPLVQTRSRADGEFRFAGLRAGDYKVFTQEAVERDPLATVPNGPVYGFPPRYFPAARDFATADTIQLHAGQTVVANIAPERQRYFDIRIPVIRPEGPPSGMEVSVHAQGHGGPGFQLGYDPDEGAIRGSLPNGSYSIEVASYEPEPATGITNITVANGPVNRPPVTLSPNINIEYNIHQDLTGAENSKMGQATTYISLRSADEFAQFRGGGGMYQSNGNPPVLTGVKPGRYWVQVQPYNGDTYLESVTSGGKDLLRAPLVVPVGASVPPIDITLARNPGHLEVTVEVPGQPTTPTPGVSGGIVMASGMVGPYAPEPQRSFIYCVPQPSDGGQVREVTGSSSNNTYFISQVPPGSYRILAFDKPQQLEYRNPAVMRAYDSKGQVVHVKAGEGTKVTVSTITSK